MGKYSRKAVLGAAAALTAASAASMTAGAATAAPATPVAPAAHAVPAIPAAPALVLSWPLTVQGDRGFRVVDIQYLLNLRVHAGLAVDGIFGPTTAAAVRHFQVAQGLHVDGQVGNQTWPKLIVTVGRGTVGNADAIRAVQYNLRNVYHYNLAVDGIFGPVTEATVRSFQARFSIPVNGIVQPTTWNTMLNGHRP